MHVRVRRKEGCLRALQYHVLLSCDVSLARFIEAATATGFARGDSHGLPLLKLVLHGHELLVVPSTERVFLRVSYTTERREREAEAARLAALLNAQCALLLGD